MEKHKNESNMLADKKIWILITANLQCCCEKTKLIMEYVNLQVEENTCFTTL